MLFLEKNKHWDHLGRPVWRVRGTGRKCVLPWGAYCFSRRAAVASWLRTVWNWLMEN